MTRVFKVLRNEINLPIVVIVIGVLIGIYHIFSYMIPFTDNAFVVTNITPVAADVSGYITQLYVKNGQPVKMGDPLFIVYQEPYRLSYEQAKSKYEEAIEHVKLIERQINKTAALLKSAEFEYEKANYEYRLKADDSVSKAVSMLEIRKLNYDVQTTLNTRNSLQRQIAVESQEVVQQKKLVNSLKAEMGNAKVNLDLTVVRAPSDGVIDNMYISVGTPIKIHEPLFSFIDTANWWVQANFNETDLRRVRPGDKVTIMLRMYYFDRIFHGEVVNTVWAAERQNTVSRSQLQKVTDENQWLLLPQRFPIQIKILDPDPKYPLNPGASAYVYIHTK
ncbi:MAG: rane fusion protein multidrug efflux system [Pseudomonadota bacterium]|nr:rane fusion protein multidrug efflux system [Pseudomonadota bacterium]